MFIEVFRYLPLATTINGQVRPSSTYPLERRGMVAPVTL
jgi:hypothetical protein